MLSTLLKCFMNSNKPKDYQNPFEKVVKGLEANHVLTQQSDVFYKNVDITAFMASGRPPKVPFSTLIISNESFENLFEISDESLVAIHLFSKKLATALIEIFDFDGITIRQHNGLSQDVWHYHLHVMPRLQDDLFHDEAWQWLATTVEERKPFADKSKKHFAKKSSRQKIR